MERRKLGESGLEIAPLVFGGNVFGWTADEATSFALLDAFVEAGFNCIDTADCYSHWVPGNKGGESEIIIGKWLRARGARSRVVIATKVGTEMGPGMKGLSKGYVARAVEASLRRLQTDYIDLYQIHWPSRVTPLDETLAALEELRQEGKVRAIGVCNFGPGDLTDLQARGWAETNQLPYSLLWRAIEYEIQQRCVAAGMGILCYSPLAQGLLTGKFASAAEVPDGRARTRLFSGDRALARHGQAGREEEAFAAIARVHEISTAVGQPMAQVALAWLLHQPGVASVITGARRPEQIRETGRAAELGLSPQIVQALAEATAALKQSLGADPDMWQAESRFR